MIQSLPVGHNNARHQDCISPALLQLCRAAENNLPKLSAVNIHYRSYTIERNQLLTKNGNKSESIYAICSGSFKSVSHSNGDSRLIDVHLPGDIVGLESYMAAQSKYDLIANERSTISELIIPPYKSIVSADFLKHLVKLCGRQFCRIQDKHEALSGKRSTLELVASFIFSLAERRCTKSIIIAELKLPLTRGEIAEYLGLASETISRQFVLLEKMKIIKSKGKRLTILDLSALRDVANISHS